MMSVHVVPDPAALARAAAGRIAAAAAAAHAARGAFRLVLAGGETPRQTYLALAGPDFASRVVWPQVEIFWGDERCVPPDDPRSNYRMARESLLGRVPIPRTQVHRIRGEDEPAGAARAYEAEVAGDVPDLVLLGLGRDGHTASLFPGQEAVGESQRKVVAEFVGAVAAWRVTMTLPMLNSARAVVFLVSGADKAEPLRRVLEEAPPPAEVPAVGVRPTSGRLDWLVDAAAGSRLSHVTSHSAAR